MAVQLTQPPASLGKTPEEIAWLEQLARIVNSLVSSGDQDTTERPTTFLFPGRFYFDGRIDMGANGGGQPIWRDAYNSEWVDANGAVI
jgi:hypothetical protein